MLTFCLSGLVLGGIPETRLGTSTPIVAQSSFFSYQEIET